VQRAFPSWGLLLSVVILLTRPPSDAITSDEESAGRGVDGW
jgi:hypothetical protein